MALSQEFWDSLHEKYVSENKGEKHWEEERPLLEEIIPSVANSISERYDIEKPIGLGGAGVVLTVTDKVLKTTQVLKCSRPVAGKEPALTSIISREISRLCEASHPNIIDIYYHGDVQCSGFRWPFFIMEYLGEGTCDAYDFISKHLPNEHVVVRMLQQCLDGLAYLHSHNTLHGDVKLENLLVASDGQVKISDLGSARLLDETGKTTVTFTRPYAHPDLLSESGSTPPSEDPDRATAQMNRSSLRTEFDLYPLGKNIIRLLAIYDPSDEHLISRYTRSYLHLMACRLLDGRNYDSERALGLPQGVFAEIKYRSAAEGARDIRKLSGEYALHNALPELDHHYPKTIQISYPGPTSFTDRVDTLLKQPLLRRLGSVSQLGLVAQVYPTASHSRLEHVLGTFANVTRYCDALWNDPVNPFFRQVMTEDDVREVLAAALCHDVGQYAHAHDLEEADPTMFSHRDLTLSILNGELKSRNANALCETLMSAPWNTDPNSVATLLSVDPMDLSQPLKMRLLHSLIDGPIDADKLDYLPRDSRNLGLPYGLSIDIERLLQCLTIVTKPANGSAFFALGVHEKGKIPAESVAFARYAMFGAVYWHHTSRSAKSMLHRAVWEALPGTDGRRREYQEFRRAFLTHVLQEYVGEGQEELAIVEFRKHLPANLSLNISDYEMLDWLFSRTTTAGKTLLSMLSERQLFKRLLVISDQKEHALWERLIAIKDWDQRLLFQRNVQSSLVERIRLLQNAGNTTSVLAPDAIDQIVARDGAGEILFLVDIPKDRSASAADLYFLPETRGRRVTSIAGGPVGSEDSTVWSLLGKSFLQSVGKVRVFCHPDIADTAEAALDREKIQSVLDWAARQIH